MTTTPTITPIQADRDATYAFQRLMLARILSACDDERVAKTLGDDEGDNAPLIQAFARHRLSTLAALTNPSEASGLITDASRIERLRRLVHRWIMQGRVSGVVHDMALQCEIDDAVEWVNANPAAAFIKEQP